MLQVRLNEKIVDPFKSEDSLIQGLKPMRAEFETKKSKLSGLLSQVENYEKGFLQETKSLDKDIMVIAEYSMRLLEKLDGYSIAEVTFFYFKKWQKFFRIQLSSPTPDFCDIPRNGEFFDKNFEKIMSAFTVFWPNYLHL